MDSGRAARAGRPVLRSVWDVAWRIAALLVLWAILLAPIVVPLAPRLDRARGFGYGWLHLLLEATAAAALLVASLAMARLFERRSPVCLGLSAAHLPRDAAAGALAGASWLAASLAPLVVLGCLAVAPSGTFLWPSFAAGIAVTAVNAFTQELVVHGYAFQVARRAWGAPLALALTSAGNVALHAPAIHGGWLPALNLFLAAAAFGVGLLRTGNLWFPIAMHFAWNALVGPTLGLVLSGRTDSSACRGGFSPFGGLSSSPVGASGWRRASSPPSPRFSPSAPWPAGPGRRRCRPDVRRRPRGSAGRADVHRAVRTRSARVPTPGCRDRSPRQRPEGTRAGHPAKPGAEAGTGPGRPRGPRRGPARGRSRVSGRRNVPAGDDRLCRGGGPSWPGSGGRRAGQVGLGQDRILSR